MRLTNEELDRLIELEKKATPAPWEAHARDYTSEYPYTNSRGFIEGPEYFDDEGDDNNYIVHDIRHASNANLIEALRNAAPSILLELKELRDRVKHIHEQIADAEPLIKAAKQFKKAHDEDHYTELMRDALFQQLSKYTTRWGIK